MTRIRDFLVIASLAVIAFVSAEVAARIDDALFTGTPVLANLRFYDLFVSLDDGIRRGVPHARFKKIQLNSLGLLGPEIPLEPNKGCQRWLFLGASETFGEPSLAGSDYPSKVREALIGARCVEVANAASPGLDLLAVAEQFDAYLFRLRPNVVFIYPPTHFYLGEMRKRRLPSKTSLNTPPGAALPPGTPHGWFDMAQLLERSRFVERIRGSAEFPAPIQRWRTQRWIEGTLRQHPADWAYRTVPEDRLDALEQDLEDLVRRVRETGAKPVLMVHAVRVADPPRPEDADDLLGMRSFTPRAGPDVFAAFEYAAADRTRAMAIRLGLDLVDLAAHLSSKRDLFIDTVHFSSAGSSLVSRLILDAMSDPSAARMSDALQ